MWQFILFTGITKMDETIPAEFMDIIGVDDSKIGTKVACFRSQTHFIKCNRFEPIGMIFDVVGVCKCLPDIAKGDDFEILFHFRCSDDSGQSADYKRKSASAFQFWAGR